MNAESGRKLRKSIWLAMLVVAALALPMLSPVVRADDGGEAWVDTDKENYVPEEIVTIFGGNFLHDATVNIKVTRPDNETDSWDTPSNDTGGFTTTYQLDGIEGYYLVEADDGTNYASTTFRDAPPKINLDQCRNGPASTPNDCKELPGSDGWTDANTGATHSHYVEGYSAPYRAVMTDLPTSTPITVTLGYDIKHSGAHALDFLTHYQRLEPHLAYGHSAETVYPKDGVTGVSSTTTEWDIPAPSSTAPCASPVAGQPTAAFNALPVAQRKMTLFGGTITGMAYVSQGCLTSSQAETQISVTFTVASATAVLAWGGHIATATVWGAGNSAGGISGSPYHMRLKDWTLGNVGSQDRSLSAGAVLPVGTVVINKVSVGGDATFPYTGTGSGIDASFSIATTGGSGSKTYADIPTGSKSVTETIGSLPAGWSFTSLTCSDPDGGTTTSGAAATIDLDTGETITCTYTNTNSATLTVIKHVVNENGGTKAASDFTLYVKLGGSNVAGSPFSGSESGTAFSLAAGTYVVSEDALTGYTSTISGDCDGSGSVTLAAGQSKTCTITNDDDAAHLKIVKVVVNDNGGTAIATDWTLYAAGPTPISGAGGAESDVDAGTYTLSEPGGPPGYTASAWVCVGGSQVGDQITLGLGESATCTITNDDVTAHLKIVKVVVNDNGGEAQETDWTLYATGPTPISGAGGAEGDVDAGTYTLSESGGPSGYTASAWVCVGGSQSGSDITVALGESATCTITNDDDAPTLTLVKVVVNDNGGTAVESDFTLTATGPTGFSGPGPSVSSGASFNAGTYGLSESGPSGYTASAWVCVGGSQSGSDITVALGESATCTITNDDDAPSLTLVKVVVNDNGGKEVASAWTLTATGPTGFSGPGPSVSSGPSFDAGTYSLSESGPSGYTASAWVCVGGSQSGSDITVALGESVTCTITNDDDAPSLTLIKVVVNDNGGTEVASAWTLTATGPTGISGTTPVVSGPSFDAGTYTLSESGPSGYTASAWVCVGGTQSGSDITVALGESVTCTITNDDDAPSLTLVKVVVNNNGGTAVPTDFTLSASGPTPISGAGGVSSGPTFSAGTYDLSETTVPGYGAGAWACSGSGSQDDDDTVTLDLGESMSCTITNNDQPPSLTLVKVVTNDDGGNAVATDFTLSASGPTPISGAGGATSDATFSAGTYDLSETTLPGYTASAWVCAGTGSQDDGDTVTLDLGETLTCTITNDDVAPKLKLVKAVVTNDGGDEDADDWTLTATGTGGFSDSGGSDAFHDVDANVAYDLTESAVFGYSASAWVCVFSVGSGPATTPITLDEGEEATCTITNDDVAPELKLVKVVINNDGGNGVADDWTLYADAGTDRDFNNLGGSGIFQDVYANTDYDLSESSIPGYTASAWSCSGGSLVGSTITLSEGVTVTCTITNDDIAPQLKLVKVVISDDGGDEDADDWTLYADAAFPDDGRNFDNLGGSGAFTMVFANVGYDLSESAVFGYTPSSWSCDGGSLSGSTVTLTEGVTVTCTITNDDIAPQLKLVKSVTNDDGGNNVADDWTLYAAAGTDRDFNNAGGSGILEDVYANAAYGLTESSVAGYDALSWICVYSAGSGPTTTPITLDEGEIATCTITNDDIAPQLRLVKVVVNNDGGNNVADDWTLSADAAAPDDGRNFNNLGGSGVFEDVFANAGYDLSESVVPGYTATGWSCDGGTLVGSTVTLDEGVVVTCTITNNDVPPQLKLVKVVTNDDGGNEGPNAWTLYADADAPDDDRDFDNLGGSGVFETVYANEEYDLSESSVFGYLSEGWACDGGSLVGSALTLDEGDVVTCTITNNDVAPKLKLVKSVTNDDGGNDVADDWVLYADAGTDRDFSNFGGSGSFETVYANSPYSLSESAVSGYTASAWVCLYSAGSGPTTAPITLDEGEEATCTITNDDIAPLLKLVKIVESDDGGDEDADDWTLTATGSGGFSDSGGSGAFHDVLANVGYDLTESAVFGYTASDWVCVFSVGSGSGTTPITLDEGEEATCTITNDDVAPRLKLVKAIINDDGGNGLPDDWILDADAGSSRDFSNLGGSGIFEEVFANEAYDLSESYVPGYTASAWVCVFSVGSGPATTPITLDEGEEATCTITNDDIAPQLKLVKVVITDDGGDEVADDWTLSATAGSGRDFSNAGGSGDFDPVFANAGYDLSESVIPGYDASDWVCTGGTLVGSTITLDEGEEATCTITNDDIAPQLKLVKVVVNDHGGKGAPDDWTLYATAGSGRDFSNAGGSGDFDPVFANAGYVLSESTVFGYAASDWVCTGGTLVGSTITLDEGEEATCTITNDDIQPRLIVVKHVINGNGGTADASDFTMAVDGAAPSPSSFPGEEAGTLVLLNAGDYEVSETGPGGYAGSFSDDCSGSIDIGEEKTCIVTNLALGDIEVIKHAISSVGHDGVFDFTLEGSPPVEAEVPTSDGWGEHAFSDLMPTGSFAQGVYVLTEVAEDGWDLTDLDCEITVPDDGSGTSVWEIVGNAVRITLHIGETVTCTFENTERGTIIVEKEVVVQGADTTFNFDTSGLGGNGDLPATFDLKTASGFVSRTFADITGGKSYTITEDLSALVGWTLVGVVCQVGEVPVGGADGSYGWTFELPAGGVVVCTFENSRPPIVTDSNLCPFDTDSVRDGWQFRLLFTQDPASPATYKLTASNPGQFYFHAFVNGGVGVPVTLTMTIPYPFVTQGANPAHVYDGFDLEDSCFRPLGDVSSGFSIGPNGGRILLTDYADTDGDGSLWDETVDVTIESLGSDTPAIVYANLHLDYGLKKTTGYGKNLNDDAVDQITGGVKIMNFQGYTFSYSFDGLEDFQTVESTNAFKKNPGFGGRVLTQDFWGDYCDPVEGAEVRVYRVSGEIHIGTTTTNEDGFYFISYKHTGKATLFRIEVWIDGDKEGEKAVTMKANTFIWTDFQIDI